MKGIAVRWSKLEFDIWYRSVEPSHSPSFSNFTINRFTLGKIVVILAGKQSVTVSSYYPLQVPSIDIEEEALHSDDGYRWRGLR